MFEPLIRDAATRFNLGDHAPRFVRMLVDAVFDSGNGGFAGMRGRFAEAGLGNQFASWIGTSPGDNALQPDQFSAGFGEAASQHIANRLGIAPAAVNTAGAGLLPRIIGLVTRGGTIPTARPVDYDRLFTAAPAPVAPANAAPAAASRRAPQPAASGSGWWKWLLALIVLGVLVFYGLRLFQSSQHRSDAGAHLDQFDAAAANWVASVYGQQPARGYGMGAGRVPSGHVDSIV